MDDRLRMVLKKILEGNLGVIFSLDGEFVSENFDALISALSHAPCTDDQIGGMIDFLRDVKNTYEIGGEL